MVIAYQNVLFWSTETLETQTGKLEWDAKYWSTLGRGCGKNISLVHVLVLNRKYGRTLESKEIHSESDYILHYVLHCQLLHGGYNEYRGIKLAKKKFMRLANHNMYIRKINI